MFICRNVLLIGLVSALLSGCAGTDVGLGGGSSEVIGDQNGGRISNALDTADKQTAAYRSVTTYCEKFGKKGYITKMNYDTGLVTFDCRVITKNRPAI
jgi:hypothetical protein